MQPETVSEPALAHVLFMDIVGCSRLPSDEQKRIVERLQELVRQSAEFQLARETDQLISLPTGDGMALAFFNKLDAAVRCAVEVMRAIQAESLCQIRMGVHTGPVFVMADINNTRNISGAGINRAERVMSCGDNAHILLSENVAESLRQLSAWRDKIREVGECRVKDGWVRVWNLVDGPLGNPALPKKAKRYIQRRRIMLGLCGTTLVALAAAMAGSFWFGRRDTSLQFSPDRASVAVLPFADLSPEKNQEYFSDGLAEELMNGLAKTPGLRVAGRTSSFQFKHQTVDSRAIGNRLNVATLLEGSVRKQGNRCRIAVQLVKAADGFQLWSESFDRDFNDIFAVQEEIAHAVTKELKVALLGDKAASFTESANAEAYNAYLQGKYYLARMNKENLAKANSYFEQAIQLDSRYAAAWAALANSRTSQALSAYIPTEEGYRKAQEAVERALAINPDLAEAHAALGWIKMLHNWDWAGADLSYQRALALEPGNAEVLRGAGSLARILGRFEEAIARYRRATEIDPLNPSAYRELGTMLYYVGRYEEATAALMKAVELAPGIAYAHYHLAEVYLAQRHPQAAQAEADREKDPILRLYGLALAYHALGQTKNSDAILAELIAKHQADAPYQIAEAYAFRGETDLAIHWLERAYAEHDPGLGEMKGDPMLKNLERDPRYEALLKKLRLPL